MNMFFQDQKHFFEQLPSNINTLKKNLEMVLIKYINSCKFSLPNPNILVCL